MSSKRKQHRAKYKFTVALEAVKGEQTISQLASAFRVHPSQVSQWKRQLLEGGVNLFENSRRKKEGTPAIKEEEFYEQIGRLKMELEWMKKKLPHSVRLKRSLVEPNHAELSIVRQCELLGLGRSSYYYEPAQETQENLSLMELIDQQYLEAPFYGSRRMREMLREHGYDVNRKRVQRLMRQMGPLYFYFPFYTFFQSSIVGKSSLIKW